MLDHHDLTAIRHYEALISARTPPNLAAAMAAARYAHGLGVAELPAPSVAAALDGLAEREPTLRREAGRLAAKVAKGRG